VAPFLWGIVTSFKSEADAAALPVRVVPEGGWTLSAYRAVFEAGDLVRWLANSLFTATVITVVTLVISAMAAYALSRGLFRGRRLLMAATLASIMVPGQILIVPLFQEMLLLNMIDTYWAIILPQVVAPVMVFVLKRFFDAIPIELEDAARVDGASRWRTFTSVVLPLSRSVLSAVAIFVFIGAWNNFLWPFIAVNDPGLMTMPVGLATVENAYGVQYAQDNAAAVLAALPLLVVFILFQRHIVRGFATTGLGGQ
jgi:multiple sugar transport system permease protein